MKWIAEFGRLHPLYQLKVDPLCGMIIPIGALYNPSVLAGLPIWWYVVGIICWVVLLLGADNSFGIDP